jgi:hypothetical protein
MGTLALLILAAVAVVVIAGLAVRRYDGQSRAVVLAFTLLAYIVAIGLFLAALSSVGRN